jgi:type III secretion protein N (ATPase)
VASEVDRIRQRLLAARDATALTRVEGRVSAVRGLVVRGLVPGVSVGEHVVIHRARGGDLRAEVVGFDDETAVLMPWGSTAGVALDDRVEPTGEATTFGCGEGLLGRVLDGMGEPCDGGGPIVGGTVAWAVDRSPPEALTRARIRDVMPLGVRALDAFVTVGVGQWLGVFAGAGAGKSVLLGQVARESRADVVVIALVGERGREVREFLEDSLGDAGRERACVVVATSDAAPLVRVRAASVATSVAEWFRDRGAKVLLVMDSLTRVARAAREVGLAAGEPPTRRGFPPSVFAMLPRLIERAGPGVRGSITALYTVLVEGGDLDEPVADEARSLLDGHAVLDRAIGATGRWPALDVVRSLSRVMDAVVTPSHRAAASRVRAWMAALDAKRDLLAVGAYVKGSDRLLDEALERRDVIERFLRQSVSERADFDDTLRRLEALAR